MQVDWRLVFFVNLPVGAWALWRGSRLLTDTRDPDPQGRPDWLGAALFAAAIGALTLGIVHNQDQPDVPDRVVGVDGERASSGVLRRSTAMTSWAMTTR